MKPVIDKCLTHPKKIASVNPVWSNIIGVTAQHKPISRQTNKALSACFKDNILLTFIWLHTRTNLNQIFFKSTKKTQTIQIYYNLQNHPHFPPGGKMGQFSKKKRTLCWSIIFLVCASQPGASSWGILLHHKSSNEYNGMEIGRHSYAKIL